MAEQVTFQKWLKHEIVEVIIQGFESHTLERDKAADAAKNALDKIGKLKTEQDIQSFMNTLRPLHPGFDTLATRVEGLFQRKREEKTADEILKLIKNGQADNAIAMAKNTME